VGQVHSPCPRRAATLSSKLGKTEQGSGWGPDPCAKLALDLNYRIQTLLLAGGHCLKHSGPKWTMGASVLYPSPCHPSKAPIVSIGDSQEVLFFYQILKT
jgi:hypothetical protein